MIGALVRNFPWWNATNPWLIFLLGYLPFWEIAYYIYDLEDRKKQVWYVGGAATILTIAFVVLLTAGLI